jgi:hypothetical protein
MSGGHKVFNLLTESVVEHLSAGTTPFNELFKDRDFLRKIPKMHFSHENGYREQLMCHQKVLLKRHPINGHVSWFQQS